MQLLLKGLISDDAERGLLDTFVKSGRNPSDQAIIEQILSAADRSENFYVIFDGLDECNNHTSRQILNFLLQLTNIESNHLHVLMTCREESHLMDAIPAWNQIRLGEAVLQDDMQSFITSSVRSSIEKGDLKIADAVLEEKVVQKLADKAHGMSEIFHLDFGIDTMLTRVQVSMDSFSTHRSLCLLIYRSDT